MTDSTDSPRALVDTYAVVYAYDLDEPLKHDRARELLKSLSDAQCLVFSAQVFNEFCSAMMKPSRKKPLRPEEIAIPLR
jgi:predicted nucleic acid-binding protein